MTGAVECRYYGRDFTAEEMALLRALIAGPPALNRHRLSKAFCRRIGWFKPDGGLKDMMARVTMLDMHRDGLIVLPPKQGRQNRPKPIVFGPDTEPPLFPTPTTLDEVRPLTLRPVVRGTREGKLWNEFIARYHYLGYRTLVGAQMRYAVHDRDGWPVAMLGFSTAAWKLAPRDTFIGWTPPPAGSMSERPRGAADTTGTSSTTSPGRTSGFGPCEEIGSEPSIGKIHRPIPARPNLYIQIAPFDWEGNEIPLGVAFGVHTFQPGDDASKALAEADRAMYEKKQERKNGG